MGEHLPSWPRRRVAVRAVDLDPVHPRVRVLPVGARDRLRRAHGGEPPEGLVLRLPEIWFRILHVVVDGVDDAPVAAYCEQTVEIARGPKGAFENGNIGTLTRRVLADRVVHTPFRRGA
jgi:hypothetical protein